MAAAAGPARQKRRSAQGGQETMAGSTQTKNLLAKSLQELMQSQPLEKISINDIV